MKKASAGMKYKIYFQQDSIHIQTKSRANAMWNHAQALRYYSCCCEQCPVQYQIRRLPGFIASYRAGVHVHGKRTKHGLPTVTQSALDDLYGQKNAPGLLIRQIQEPSFPADLKDAIVNGKDINDSVHLNNFKGQCQNFIYHKKKQCKLKKVPLPAIGSNQSSFKIWLHEKSVQIAELLDPHTLEEKRSQIDPCPISFSWICR